MKEKMIEDGFKTVHVDVSLGGGEQAVLPLSNRLGFKDQLVVIEEDGMFFWMLKRA